MVRILVFILKALGRWYSFKQIGLFLKNTDQRKDWTQSRHEENRKALEIIQEWDSETLDHGGSCEDEETWTELEVRISDPSWSNKHGREGEGGVRDGCQVSGLLICGWRCYLFRGWRRKEFEGEAMSSVLGHAEFEALWDGQVEMLKRQLDLWLGALGRV